MKLKYTLFSEGSSDAALLPILDWLLIQAGIPPDGFVGVWADLRQRRSIASPTQSHKLALTVSLFPCDLLFVHRDADNNPISRIHEELSSVIELSYQLGDGLNPPAICVIPVKMTESWLMFDETAIRIASGNRNGIGQLKLPELRQIESIREPKVVLGDLLKSASGLHGRRLKQLNISWCKLQITKHIPDFSPLRALSAFSLLEENIKKVIKDMCR